MVFSAGDDSHSSATGETFTKGGGPGSVMDRKVYSAALRFPPEFPHGRRITFVGLNRTPH